MITYLIVTVLKKIDSNLTTNCEVEEYLCLVDITITGFDNCL